MHLHEKPKIDSHDLGLIVKGSLLIKWSQAKNRVRFAIVP
jgi:hypothetical protein